MPGMRSLRAAGLIGVMMALLAVTSPATAATTCTYDGGTKTVTVTMDDALVALQVEGGAIVFVAFSGFRSPGAPEMRDLAIPSGPSPQPCGGATTANTDTINVTGGAPEGSVFIVDQTTGGPFAPGATAEATGVSEIEFTVDPATPTFAAFIGTSAPDVMRVGTLGVNLNNDDDVDVTLGAQVVVVALDGVGGNDQLSALGDAVTGGPSSLSFFGAGGPGTDTLLGAARPDQLAGMGGRDRLIGNAGRDSLAGGGGKDLLAGGPGGDLLQGQGGRDKLKGGPKRDFMDGGGGPDRCVGGPGNDFVDDCER